MTPYTAPGLPSWLADACFPVGLALCLLLRRAGLWLQAHERERWWASNARDGVNLLAVLLLTAAGALQGLSLPLAILVGASLTLWLSLADGWLRRRIRHPLAGVIALALVLGVPLVLAPATLAAGAARALSMLFPGLLLPG